MPAFPKGKEHLSFVLPHIHILRNFISSHPYRDGCRRGSSLLHAPWIHELTKEVFHVLASFLLSLHNTMLVFSHPKLLRLSALKAYRPRFVIREHLDCNLFIVHSRTSLNFQLGGLTLQ